MNVLANGLIAILILSGITGCAHFDRERIRDGLLTQNIRQSAFLDEWGKPDRIYLKSGDEIIQASVNSFRGGSFYKGKHTFEVWVYESKKTELVFNSRKRLAGWTTSATVNELSSEQKN